MMRDVFDSDSCIINQDPDRQGQPSEGHDIDGLPERGQRDQRGQYRKRNGDGNDQGCAPTAEEQQDHQRSQACRDQRFPHHAGHGGLHEYRLIGKRRDVQRLRQSCRYFRQHGLDLSDDGQRRRTAGLFHREQRGALAVAAHDVGLRRIAVAHLRDVPYIHHTTFDSLDRQVVERRDAVRAAVHLDVVFASADLGGATGQDQVLRVDGIDHVAGRQAFGLQRAWIDVDHDLADLAAEGQRDGRALHRGKLRTYEAVAEVVERLLGQRIARQPQLQDRNSRRVVRNDVRRQRARRQHAQDGFGIRAGFGDGAIDVGAGVKEYLDHRDAVQRLRFNVFDVFNIRSQRAFIVRRDPVRHVLRGETVIRPDDAYHRDIDIRENIRRGAHDGKRSDQEQQDRKHNEGIGPAQGQSDNPHWTFPENELRLKSEDFVTWGQCDEPVFTRY